MRHASYSGSSIPTGLGTKPDAAGEDVDGDEALVDRIASGDRQAFETLYRRYHPRLKRFLTHITRRPALVEEVLNDTLMVVWRRPDRFNGQSRVSTWIFAIAYRQALQAMRRQDQPIEDKDADRRPATDAAPDQSLDADQRRAALSRAMGDLSPDHRAVIDLTYYHELGYREIAGIMGCPEDTVKTRMFHARRHLKRILAGRLADWL